MHQFLCRPFSDAFQKLLFASPISDVVESFPRGTFSYLASRIRDVEDLRYQIPARLENGSQLHPAVAFRLGSTVLIGEVKLEGHGTAQEALKEALFYRLNLLHRLKNLIQKS
jgi:cation transporter-like permease